MSLKLHPVIQKDIEEICKTLGSKLSQFEGMDILITGAGGMLARYLVYTLLYANDFLFTKKCKLHLVVRNSKILFGKRQDIEYIYVDIAEETLPSIDADYIIHAASKAAPKIYTKHMLDTLNTNIKGLYTVLDSVSKNTKSILYFSSGEIYGNPPKDTRLTEEYLGITDHLNERSCYVEGKKAGETICMNYFREKKFPIKIARIFHTFGPCLNLDDGRVFSDFIHDGLQHKNITIKGNKNIKRAFLYIQDATIMFFLLLLSSKNGEVYNIANDKNVVSVDQLAEIVRDEFNTHFEKKLHIEYQTENRNVYVHAPDTVIPDVSRFKKVFGYAPKISVKQAFRRTIASFFQ
ncbi:hypothetical protein COU87_02180 [Candidatus Roizmanbacteria bacterium CG10_big_fil_rev_8_21_14_0_10_39_12]|uniref:NAD-dependent epimerase/dehydratase domain-containing protein n=1 Tax=Candidatus Roizmanbacteria bacterium CG10_big_fil_rev_8_21_14_0_10_39_12 TaxID=1974852 RepID=A0A2M8KPQ5_9BACT|nr:MAG: hypothetical protein COU87_02180 [Candidatus Roizmanbacteria bacterium CG10_big_fil_rev_8_21_14_0_10_39_12]